MNLIKLEHPWLFKFPISQDAKYLIIGTHPPMPYTAKLEFYYGNMNEFWRFLDHIYPGNDLYSNGCTEIRDVLFFLKKIKMSITDIVNVTHVEKFSTDNEMGKIQPEDLNPELFQWLKDSKIETIYFTSFGGANSAKNLFKKWYRNQFGKVCKISSAHVNEVEMFGRLIEVIDLFSPSPTAKRGSNNITEYKDWLLNGNGNNDYDDFRIYWYKKYLPKN